METHSVFTFYKAVRIFDPRQLPTLSHNISDYRGIPD